jgi:3-oxoacyl-[acyl-carrier-protein] synthase II
MGLVSNNSQNSNDFGINCMKGHVGIKQCDFFDESIKTKMFGATDILGFENRPELLMKRCVADFFNNGVDKKYIESFEDNCHLFFGSLYSTNDVEYKFVKNKDYLYLAYKNSIYDLMKHELGIKGAIHIVNVACASSTTAIGMAFDYIKNGMCEISIAGGLDALSIITVNNFNVLKNVSKTVINPFDKHRNGMSIGEGGAIFLLESLDHAIKRHANILCEIVSYATNNEAYGLTSPNPNGDGIYNVMVKALKNADLMPKNIDYINAHGTGTMVNDSAEMNAIERLFGEKPILVSSTKALIGHCMGGTGALEIASVIESMNRNQYLPMPNLTAPISEKVIMKNKTFDCDIKYVIKNNFGFSGNNVSMVLKAGENK